MKRAYSVLTIKSIDDDGDERLIEGIATTPEPDRVGDIVEPLGAKFADEMPFLFKHDHDAPIGHVRFGKPTRKGIPFEARIAKVTEPGVLKDRVDEAWQSIKYRLMSAVSIGFRAFPEGIEPIKGGGLRFTEYEVLELSLVAIPANADASITSIKSLDRSQRAASGHPAKDPVIAPGATGQPTRKGEPAMDINQQVEDLQQQRESLITEMKGFGDVTDLDDDQATEYDGIAAQFDQVEQQLARAQKMQKAMNAARPINGGDRASGTNHRAPSAPAIIKQRTTEELDPGIAFARIAKIKAIAKMDSIHPRELAKAYYGNESGVYRFYSKAAVPAATTMDETWAGALVGEETSAFADFVEFLRPMTIVGRFGANGIPALRRVPFRVPLIGQTSGGQGWWVGEGQAKPVTKFDFNRSTLQPRKVANIAVSTEEVLRYSSPAADALIRDALAAALQERMDLDFVDPAKAEVADISPASITNDVTPIPSSGSDADAVRADIKAVFDQFIADNNAPTTGVWIMSSTTALSLSLMYNPLGNQEFPGMTMNGGTLGGLPVITSEYVPTDSSGALVILANASDVYFADDGEVAVDLSREASLQMMDNPTNDSGEPTATPLVSMFQTNSVAFRAERTLNWKKRRPGAVAVLTGVQWGDGAAAA